MTQRKRFLMFWCDIFGWRRFFIMDWWRLKMGRPVRLPEKKWSAYRAFRNVEKEEGEDGQG